MYNAFMKTKSKGNCDSFVDAGDLHWKIVSVYINKMGQVCLLSSSTPNFDVLKTCHVKKLNVVDFKSFFVSRKWIIQVRVRLELGKG